MGSSLASSLLTLLLGHRSVLWRRVVATIGPFSASLALLTVSRASVVVPFLRHQRRWQSLHVALPMVLRFLLLLLLLLLFGRLSSFASVLDLLFLVLCALFCDCGCGCAG